MQFWHKFVPSQGTFVNDFIHFELIKIVEFFIFYRDQFFLATNRII